MIDDIGPHTERGNWREKIPQQVTPRPHPQGGYTLAMPCDGAAKTYHGNFPTKRAAFSAARSFNLRR